MMPVFTPTHPDIHTHGSWNIDSFFVVLLGSTDTLNNRKVTVTQLSTEYLKRMDFCMCEKISKVLFNLKYKFRILRLKTHVVLLVSVTNVSLQKSYWNQIDKNFCPNDPWQRKRALNKRMHIIYIWIYVDMCMCWMFSLFQSSMAINADERALFLSWKNITLPLSASMYSLYHWDRADGGYTPLHCPQLPPESQQEREREVGVCKRKPVICE